MDEGKQMANKINLPGLPKLNQAVIDRVYNLASYGASDDEIVELLGFDIDDRSMTRRLALFIASQARKDCQSSN